MLQRLRHRAQGQEGFTLIELLVVILIIGILAAVAIPTFLSQTAKAHDSNAQGYLNSAQTAEATWQTSNGSYTNSAAQLKSIEPTLNSASSLAATLTANGFRVSDQSTGDNILYSLTYDSTTGGVVKGCHLVGGAATSGKNVGGCNNSNSW